MTTLKLKLWQNSKTETETKHKIFKCNKIPRTQIVTKLEKKILTTQNSNCDKTQKLKLQQNLKTQIVTKLKKIRIMTILKNNSNIDKTKKNQTVTKLKKNLNCGKTQELKLW